MLKSISVLTSIINKRTGGFFILIARINEPHTLSINNGFYNFVLKIVYIFAILNLGLIKGYL